MRLHKYTCMPQMNFGVRSHVSSVIFASELFHAAVMPHSLYRLAITVQLTCIMHMHLVVPVKAAQNHYNDCSFHEATFLSTAAIVLQRLIAWPCSQTEEL